jgi:hypothetical protein
MKLNFSFILSFFLLSVVYSQQSSVVKSYTTTFKKIDSLNLRGIDKEQTDRLLKSIEQSKDFKENDTLKAMVYLTRGVYYMNQDKDLKKSEFYSTEAEKLYIKIGMLNKASTALHNKSVLYQIFNKIDTAIVIGNKAIEMGAKSAIHRTIS